MISVIEKIGDNAAYVTGAVRSAIYCFDTGKVYSLNEHATSILTKYFQHSSPLIQSDKDFIEQVERTIERKLDKHCSYSFPTVENELKFVWLELTQRCNFKCLHCYQGETHKINENEMSIEEWKDIISQCAELKCDYIQFIGGEPCLYAGLPELIYFARRLGIKSIALFTNLSCITPEIISAIIDNDILVNFSIYGASAEFHDTITQIHGSFEILKEKIKILRKFDIKMRAM